jgi:membrane-associated HD superfamily phosphohydrolase
MDNDLTQLLSFEDVSSQTALQLGVRFVLSLIAGLIVAFVFRRSRDDSNAQSDRAMFATLVLLSVLICMVTAVIGNYVARAFSLAGALSIVRFRTIVEDTRDTAFVIFAVVVGMAIGYGQILVPLIGIPIVSVAAILLKDWSKSEMNAHTSAPGDTGTLLVRVGLGIDATEILKNILEEQTKKCTCVQVATTKQGAAIEIKYRVSLSAGIDPVLLINKMNRIEGVQSATLDLET